MRLIQNHLIFSHEQSGLRALDSYQSRSLECSALLVAAGRGCRGGDKHDGPRLSDFVHKRRQTGPEFESVPMHKLLSKQATVGIYLCFVLLACFNES